jgi:FkbM family methyltransferase
LVLVVIRRRSKKPIRWLPGFRPPGTASRNGLLASTGTGRDVYEAVTYLPDNHLQGDWLALDWLDFQEMTVSNPAADHAALSTMSLPSQKQRIQDLEGVAQRQQERLAEWQETTRTVSAILSQTTARIFQLEERYLKLSNSLIGNNRVAGNGGAGNLREFMSARPDYRLSVEDISDNSLRPLVERYCEQRCSFVPMPDDRILCKVLGKYLTWVDAFDQGLSPHLIFQGYWEMWVTAVMARFVRRGTTVVDIGANVGYYTLQLAEAVGPEGKVIAFEPNPRIAEMLRMSISINGFSSIVNVRSEAVSAKCGPGLTFAIPKHEPKNAGLVRTAADRNAYLAQFGEKVSFIDVPEVTLDSLALSNVGIVKIDAEGAEESVWEGMQGTIDSNPKICVVLEFNCSRGYDAVDFYRRISKRFAVRHIDFDGAVKPLTLDMLASQRKGDDWMLFLSRD